MSQRQDKSYPVLGLILDFRRGWLYQANCLILLWGVRYFWRLFFQHRRVQSYALAIANDRTHYFYLSLCLYALLHPPVHTQPHLATPTHTVHPTCHAHPCTLAHIRTHTPAHTPNIPTDGLNLINHMNLHVNGKMADDRWWENKGRNKSPLRQSVD